MDAEKRLVMNMLSWKAKMKVKKEGEGRRGKEGGERRQRRVKPAKNPKRGDRKYDCDLFDWMGRMIK